MTRYFDLDGHVALVTGGNTGIGLGMARALGGAGARVALLGTNEERNTAAVDELTAAGIAARAYVCDVSHDEAVSRTFELVLQDHGRIDSCFANAGVGGAATRFTEMTLEEWRRVIQVNLDGAFLTLRAASAHMIDRGGGGSLVATSSLTALEGAPRSEHYAASKAALLGVVRSLAVELGRYQVRVNAIVPGWIDTNLTHGTLGAPRFVDRVLSRVPLGRWGTPDDLGGVAIYLASPGSAYHTGDVLVIDGGYHVQ
jgi:NAD(P)-dependent dehydrogenase (short-subunit alcohol dehydrogenase family)